MNQLREYSKGARRLVVEGHTDNVGDDILNKNLSQGRADAVRAILLEELGLEPNKIEAIGFGESSPVETNSSAWGRARNRRVQLKIYD